MFLPITQQWFVILRACAQEILRACVPARKKILINLQEEDKKEEEEEEAEKCIIYIYNVYKYIYI